MKYKVGQVLYMTSEKSLNVIPIQVVEEVVRTTLTGKEKTYMVMFPDQNNTVVDITETTGRLFVSKKDLKQFMTANATKAIDKMLEKAEKICASRFSIAKESLNKNIDEKIEKNVHNDVNNDIITVDLGNGLTGKLNQKDISKVKNNESFVS